MATGIQNAWSTTPATNATADSALGPREGWAPSLVNDTIRSIMSMIKKLVLDTQGGTVTAGTSTAYTLTTNETLALADGVTVTCRMSVTNGAAPTLNVDSTGAIAIQSAQGTAVPTAALRIGGVYKFTYYHASPAWIVSGTVGIPSLPIGMVFDHAGTTAPSLSLLCYGQAVSRTTYAALFAVISDTYGAGDASTTFNVPDLRGRVVAGKDDMGGSSANRLTDQSGGLNGDTLGDTGGSETHTLIEDELPAHDHGVTDPGHTHIWTQGGAMFAVSGGGSGLPGGSGIQTIAITGTNSAAVTGVTVNNAGGDDPHNNVQPTIILNKCIFAGA